MAATSSCEQQLHLGARSTVRGLFFSAAYFLAVNLLRSQGNEKPSPAPRASSAPGVYGRVKTNNAEPAAIATYSLPSTAYAMGAAWTAPPIWKCHSTFPVVASRAMKFPSESPLNTSPPAVDKTPDQLGDTWLNSHFRSPVSGSIARSAPQ